MPISDNKRKCRIWLTGVIIGESLIAGYPSYASLASRASLPLGDARWTDVPAGYHIFSCDGENFESVAHRSDDWTADGRYKLGKKSTF
ncbi:MAG: hypothetical protein VX745_11975 [Pseudomonadota bacterium]|nr:hypothetical protein [Pseudomonadota bacterium]